MGARREYVIDVLLNGDDSGLRPIERGLNHIEDMVENLNGKKVGVNINANGDALETLREIEGHLDGLHGHDISINLGGNVEEGLRNIEGHLESLSKNFETRVNVGGNWDSQLRNIHGTLQDIQEVQTLKIDIDMGRSTAEIQSIASSLSSLSDEIRNISGTHLGDVAGVMVHGFQSANGELGKIQQGISQLGSGGGSDIGRKLANDFNDAGNQVGRLQKQLDQLRPPDFNQYYGRFDQLGRLDLGAIGGSSILSMVGVQGFKNVTWGNASTEQTNNILLQKMDRDETGPISMTTFEGGTDTITHAVSQNRSVRNPDLIAQLYAFKMATGASNAELMSNVFGGEVDTEWGSGSMVDVLAAFGENVALQTGSEQLGTSAMFDLAKAFGGQYASVDQYGISPETLQQYGYDPKSENVTEFMRAVGQIIGADAPNELMNTTEGGLTQVRKRFHRAGRMIGQMFMGPVDLLSNLFLRLDKADIELFGMKIPKGTFTQAIIGITGLVSAINPLQQTFRAVQDTFNRVKGAVQTATDGLSSLTEKLINFGHASKIDLFNEMGAYNTLSRDKFVRENPSKVLQSRILGLEQLRGVHDFSVEDIEQSNLTRNQKRRVMGGRELDERLFKLEGLETEDIHKRIHYDLTSGNDKEFEEQIRNLTEMEKIQARSREAQRRMSIYDVGRKNEISELSNWQKLKQGIRGSFSPQTSAFSKGYRKERDKYKDGGWLNQLKGKTIGNLKGLSSGLKSLKDEGGFKSALGNLKGVLGGVLGALNPVNVALAALGAVLAGIASIFLIANANSEDFRNKLQKLADKLHLLMDTVFYAVGDMFKASGLSSTGGIDGIIEVADNAVDCLIDLVGLVTDILSAMTGRNVERDKLVDPVKKDLDKTIDSVKSQEEANGGKLKAGPGSYQRIANDITKLQMYDPSFNARKYLEEKGFADEGYTDSNGVKLIDHLVDPKLRDSEYTEWDYFGETTMARAEELGLHLDENELKEAIKDNPELANKLDTAISEQSAHNTSRWFGKDFNDNEFSKITGIKSEPKEGDPIAGDSALGRIIDPIFDTLWWIAHITGAILAILAAEKTLGALSKLDKLWSTAKGGSKLEKVTDIVKTQINKKLPNLSKWLGNKKNGLKKLGDIWGVGKKKPKVNWNKTPDWMRKSHKRFKGINNYDKLEKTGKFLKEGILNSSIGKKLFPKDGAIREFGRKLSQAFTDISKNSFTEWLQSSKRLKGVYAKITSKLPILTKLFGSEGFLGKPLRGIAKWLGEKGIGKSLTGIFGKIGTYLGGKIGVNAIPVIGQIIDALWIAWDLASWIGDFLDTNIPWAGQLFAMISPLRMIQKMWTDISNAATGFGQMIQDGLRSIGLGAFADMLQTVWDKIVGIYNTIQNIPFIGDLIPGDPIPTGDGGDSARTAEEVGTVTGDEVSSSLSSTPVSTDLGDASRNINNSISPELNAGAYSFAFATGYKNTVPTSMTSGQPLANNSNQGNTVNNNITISGYENGEELSRLVVNTINEKVLFDAQRGGRTVDGQPNVSL